MDGDEVVQVYIKNLNVLINQPVHSLKAYQRVTVKSGETKTITFELAPEAFDYIDDQGKKISAPGQFQVFVGGGQPGYGEVLSKVVSRR